MSGEKSWIQQIPGWIEATRGVKIPPGVNKQESQRRAHSMRVLLRDGKISAGELKLDDDLINTFYALCELLENPDEESREEAPRDAEAVHRLISEITWPDDEFGEREDLLRRCLEVASRWSPSEEKGGSGDFARAGSQWPFLAELPGRKRRLAPEEGWREAERVLAVPIAERREKAEELRLDDPELLLSVCEVLRSRMETSPAGVQEEAKFFHDFVEARGFAIEQVDQRQYLLGELAMAAGAACRFLFQREECFQWFDRAEARFVLTEDAPTHLARLAYQRMALAVEERRFTQVLNSAPLWAESMSKLGLVDDALKCKFLLAASHWELGNLPLAVNVYREISREAEERRNPRLLAQAMRNLAECYRRLGDLNEAVDCARKALPCLEQLNSRVHLVKLHRFVGDVLRDQANLSGAIDAYREAKREAEELGTRFELVAMHLLLAGVLLEVGLEREAESEIRAALPTIDKEKMFPEGIAALALLRESLRFRRVDRTALRELQEHLRNVK